jgi:hypothetical protein
MLAQKYHRKGDRSAVVGKPGNQVGKPGVGKPGFGKPGVGKPGVGKPGVGKPGRTLAGIERKYAKPLQEMRSGA